MISDIETKDLGPVSPPVEKRSAGRPADGIVLAAFVIGGVAFIAVVSMSSALVAYAAWRLFDWLMG